MAISDYQIRKAAGSYWLLYMNQTGKDSVLPIPLNESGAEIWNMLADGYTVEQIAQEFHIQYGIEQSEAMEDVQQFVAQLREQGIME